VAGDVTADRWLIGGARDAAGTDHATAIFDATDHVGIAIGQHSAAVIGRFPIGPRPAASIDQVVTLTDPGPTPIARDATTTGPGATSIDHDANWIGHDAKAIGPHSAAEMGRLLIGPGETSIDQVATSRDRPRAAVAAEDRPSTEGVAEPKSVGHSAAIGGAATATVKTVRADTTPAPMRAVNRGAIGNRAAIGSAIAAARAAPSVVLDRRGRAHRWIPPRHWAKTRN
jgi:hypothetical protein